MSEPVFAAWASRERSDQSGHQTLSHGRDRVRYVPFRPQWRILGVDNLGELKAARTARRNVLLRGESSPARRSGIRRLRCTAWRGDGSRAIAGPRSDRDRLMLGVKPQALWRPPAT